MPNGDDDSYYRPFEATINVGMPTKYRERIESRIMINDGRQ